VFSSALAQTSDNAWYTANPKMKRDIVSLAIGVALLAGCNDATGVPDLNNPAYEDVLSKPLTRIGLQNLVTGYHDAQRSALGQPVASYIIFGEIMARDAYRIDASENRYVNHFLNGTPDPSAFSGSANFAVFFRDIRAANTILQALPSIPDGEGVTDQQKSSIRGMIRTMKAIDYYRALEYRDTLGIPFAVEQLLGSPLAPIVCKSSVLTSVSSLLDSAYADLIAGGSSFPVAIPRGFAGFDTPATFAQFNRGWKAKVELYRALEHTSPTGGAGFRNSITALHASFISATDMEKGVYFTFSTSSGDLPNPLVDGNLHLNPQVSDSLQSGDRRGVKIVAAPQLSVQGLTYRSNFRVSQTQPIAYLKSEELVLLRAQANVGLGDLVGALADVNLVRAASGGLPPLPPFADASAAIDAILREKRYSLLLESAHRLVDLRAYRRLNATYFKKERPGDVFVKALPIPQNESDQRNGNVTPVCS
jgi:hypothetical protein